MQYSEIGQKTKELNQVINTVVFYEGDGRGRYYGFTHVNNYVRKIFDRLEKAIYDGFEGDRDRQKQLNKYIGYVRDALNRADRNYVHDMARKSPALGENHIMDDLKEGAIYHDFTRAMLLDRLYAEVGEAYHNKTLHIDAELRLDRRSPAFIRAADEGGTKVFYFNPAAIVLMSKPQKEAAMNFMAAHTALGHLKGPAPTLEALRRREINGAYVGALIDGDVARFRDFVDFLRHSPHFEANGGSFYERQYTKHGRDAPVPGKESVLDMKQYRKPHQQAVRDLTREIDTDLSNLGRVLESHAQNYEGLKPKKRQELETGYLRREIERRKVNGNGHNGPGGGQNGGHARE